MAFTFEDRLPWLEAMSAAIRNWLDQGGIHVLACSALKRSYRDLLKGHDDRVHFVYLKADKRLAAARIAQRSGHYMKANMVDSQFATLEEPRGEHEFVVDASQPPREIVDEICRQYNLTEAEGNRIRGAASVRLWLSVKDPWIIR